MNDSYHIFTSVTTITSLEMVRSFLNQSNNKPINNQLVTTMSTQDKFPHVLIAPMVREFSTEYGPDYDTIRRTMSAHLPAFIISEDELRGLVFESFICIWNLSVEEFDMLEDDLTAMFLHCKDTNPELFAEFEANTFNKVKFDSDGSKYNYPCVHLDVDGTGYMLVGGTPLHLHLFYGEVMFDRFGPYTGRIELTHGEFEAIRTKTLFFPQVYVK